MPWDLIFFFTLAAICLLTAVLVVVSENPVHSGLFLVLCFLGVAGVFVLLGSEFLAVLQIIVYTGAVLVLLLFVLMLVDPDKLPTFYTARPLQRYVSALIGVVLVLELGAAIISRTAIEAIGPDTPAAIAAVGGNVQAIGIVVFTDYVLALEIVSLVLTVGVVGAVVIGLPERLGEKARATTSTISLGHARGSDNMLGAGPRFETPIASSSAPARMAEGPRTVVMAKSADEYTRAGEISR
jgi:NADH-quinone oxidoreductase subunit J